MASKEKRKREHLHQSLSIKKKEIHNASEFSNHLAVICDHFEVPFSTDTHILRWGKCVLPGDITLRSRISEEGGQASRSSRYFEATEQGPIFGEALAFYSLPNESVSLVVYHQLIRTEKVLGRWCGEWSDDYMVLKISSITSLVGIWEHGSRVHILRRHVGLVRYP